MSNLTTRLSARNVGDTDRILRVFVGALLLALVFVGPATPLGLIGLIPLATGLWGRCPLYALLPIATPMGPSIATIMGPGGGPTTASLMPWLRGCVEPRAAVRVGACVAGGAAAS